MKKLLLSFILVKSTFCYEITMLDQSILFSDEYHSSIQFLNPNTQKVCANYLESKTRWQHSLNLCQQAGAECLYVEKAMQDYDVLDGLFLLKINDVKNKDQYFQVELGKNAFLDHLKIDQKILHENNVSKEDDALMVKSKILLCDLFHKQKKMTGEVVIDVVVEDEKTFKYKLFVWNLVTELKEVGLGELKERDFLYGFFVADFAARKNVVLTKGEQLEIFKIIKMYKGDLDQQSFEEEYFPIKKEKKEVRLPWSTL